MSPDVETWREVLDGLDDEPPALEVSDALAAATAIAESDAYEHVIQAIDDGLLVERGEGFGYVELAEEYREGEDTPEASKPAESDAEEADISTTTPGCEAVEPAEEAAVEALDDAIAYFNSKLDSRIGDHTDDGDHPDRPTAAREYFAARGWDDETIDEMRLGWAPASRTGLLDHLMKQGHGREAIIGTGLFTDDLAPLWKGRYVLPYFDDEGRPVYAIARCTGAKGGGAVGYDGHPEDGLAGKYAKLRHTDDRVPFDEPIWGHHTLEEGEPVVVAEGIADAITATEAGYSVLSPVAKEFKKEHYGPLLEAIERFDVPRVTVVPDSERAGFDAVDRDAEADRIREHVSIPATSPGMGGALRTADHLGGELQDVDTSVHVADLPLPATSEGFHKVDLDDYLHGWAEDLDAVLASAKPAEAYPEYEAATTSRSTSGEADDSDDSGVEHVGNADSGLWDLDLDDLENIKDGERTKNPFAHTGDSEKYFVGNRQSGGDIIAKDYKGTGDGVTYNALTGLLVDAGKRSRDDPEGPLSDAEVFHAWKQAKKRRDLGDGDPVPYRGLLGIAVEEGVVDRDDLVVRDADTGDVVEDPDEHDGDTYEAFPPGAYADALEHVEEEHDVDPGREVPEYDGGDEPDDEEAATGRELLDLDVVVEPANALAAAAAIEPDDLDEPLPELEREDVDDVAIAVALADGMIDSAGEFPDDGRYTEAYYRARDHYGAPLPKYLDNSTLEERADLVFAALERVEPTHILDSLESDITVEDPDGKAIAKINPTWEESESGERILAGYGRGFYCTRHSPDQPERWRTFDALQVVALEHELVRSEFRRPSGEAFKEAYRLLREQYGAPVPKWRATLLEHVAVLPPAARVLGENSADRSLETARKETEALLRDAVDVRDRGQLITNVAGSGKTFSSAIIADEKPELYTAQRNELKQQMEEYAAEIRASDDIAAEPTTRHLPILSADLFDDVVRHDAVEAVREHGRRLLRDRDELLEAVEIPDDPSEEDDEDGVDLDRATCPTASGEHGDAWALAVQTARELKINPAKIHENDTAIFGDPLPCQHDGEECPYSLGWDDVRNPDDSADILIGSPGHAKVDSATTYFDRGPDGERTEHDRAVVVDEFVGDSYMNLYGDRYLDFATWLADALVGIDTREDLVEADLDADTWVNLWLEGDGAEYADTGDAIDLLDDGRKLCTARREAEAALESGVDTDAPTSAGLVSVREALGELRDGTPTDGALDDVAATLNQAITTIREEADTAYATGDQTDAGRLYGLADDLEDVYKPLAAAIDRDADTPLVDALAAAVDALPVGGDLRRLLKDAVDVLRGEDAPEGLLDAAITTLEGGRDGCRELAIYAEDGYAHPDAWALLAGAIAQDTTVVESETFAFDGDEGSTYKRLTTNGATVLADKNQHGAIVVDPPAFTDITGDKCPVLALDATGRPELWKIALGRDVERRDIHDSDAERRGFLRENGYAVVQTTTDPLPYHSDPAGKSKNFSEDLELVRTVAEEYTGTGPDAVDDKGPAVISTKKVVDYLADDLDEHAGATINYENMKGSDALGDHQAAVILGSCHYGDAAPEMWGLLAGEDAGRGDTRGDTLDYGSDVANAYLRYMREDTTMQAILRAGRNDDDTVVFAHTGALRDDLPVVDEGVVLSAHSKGTLAVAEAAREYGTQPFTATDLVDAIAEDDRAVGRRQVQNILADLRGSGYLRVVEEGGPGVGYEYELEEEPGLADVELPEPGETADSDGTENEISPNETMNTWNFVSPDRPPGDRGMLSPSRPTIPATDAAEGVADGVEPPG